MIMKTFYEPVEPSRAGIEKTKGPLVLEFGTPWCGYCRALQPALKSVLSDRPELPHLKVEDGPGCPLGRSFMVTLWPTLVLLHDGHEVARAVRPETPSQLERAFDKLESVMSRRSHGASPPTVGLAAR